MSDREQLDAFHADLDKLVARYIDEFDLSFAGAIGVLEMKCHEIKHVAFRRKFGEDEQGAQDE